MSVERTSIEQAQKWFLYLQIPRKADYSDARMFDKIITEADKIAREGV